MKNEDVATVIKITEIRMKEIVKKLIINNPSSKKFVSLVWHETAFDSENPVLEIWGV